MEWLIYKKRDQECLMKFHRERLKVSVHSLSHGNKGSIISWVLVLAMSIFFMLVVTLGAGATFAADTPEKVNVGLEIIEKGTEKFLRGNYAEAANHWWRAADLYESANEPELQVKALIRFSEALHYTGRYRDAITALTQAINLSARIDNLSLIAIIHGRLGNAHFALDEVQSALGYFIVGLILANKEVTNLSLKAAIYNDLGNLLAIQAVELYQESEVWKSQKEETYQKEARQLGKDKNNRAISNYVLAVAGARGHNDAVLEEKGDPDYHLEVTARLNLAKAFMLNDQYEKAKEQVDEAANLVQKLNPTSQNAYGLAFINIGLAYKELRNHLPGSRKSLFLLAETSFEKAATIAGEIREASIVGEKRKKVSIVAGKLQEVAIIGDKVSQTTGNEKKEGYGRLESYALGHIGNLYEEEGHFKKAFAPTENAVIAARLLEHSESLYRWEWQLGRILRNLKRFAEAEKAYKRAVKSLKKIPRDMPKGVQATRGSFRNGPGRLFFKLSEFYLEEPHGEKCGGSLLFCLEDFGNPKGFVVKLRDATDPVSQYLKEQFSPNARRLVDEYVGPSPPSASLQTALIIELNELLRGASLYDEQRFKQVILREKTRKLVEQNLQGKKRISLNRWLLEDAYPMELEGNRLIQARAIMEEFKTAEIQDYYQDDCVEAYGESIQTIDTVIKTRSGNDTIVMYPMVFPDRVELLVNLPTDLRRYTLKISENELKETINEFRWGLEQEETGGFKKPAKQLYKWLIKPMEADLVLQKIKTIVFVPDGHLRTIPFAALYDEETQEFLIQKFAIATASALNLPDPKPMDRDNIKILSVGLTTGGEEFAPLPGVTIEQNEMQRVYGANNITTLFDEDFLVANVEKAMKKDPFTIVHVATHGKFENDVTKSFLLASNDKKLTMNDLDQMMGLFKFRDTPLDLLTLSACETAAGDDRAALGLAGIALKAGARSALATLWSINDEASSKLVSWFYEELHNTQTLTKAQALQQAQIRMLKKSKPHYQHPFYWSAFLLLNNWL
jgi:CHAT domain-containing protein